MNTKNQKKTLFFEGESARQERSSQASRWGDIKHQYTQNNLKFSRELRQNASFGVGGYL